MLLIYSSANGLLGCSNLLATMNSAAMNTHIQISESLFSILWGIHLRLGLLGLMVTYVHFWRNHQSIFHSSCITLHFHEQCMRLFQFLHSLANTCLFFKIIAILIGVKWYSLFLICISVKTKDVEDLFMCLQAICIYLSWRFVPMLSFKSFYSSSP